MSYGHAPYKKVPGITTYNRMIKDLKVEIEKERQAHELTKIQLSNVKKRLDALSGQLKATEALLEETQEKLFEERSK